ncbi:MAG TPA: hypothetical protein VKC89_02825 [Patescibacteria group bacterium]|nr:hypothetical protein [Patescibacteria group bacterium]
MKLTIGWLYPQLMSTYGDKGNIIVLKKRCEWRGIEVEVLNLDVDSPIENLKKCDLLFMGGAQDRQQKIVSTDLKKKSKILRSMIENNVPGLYICGAYQFLGKYYKEANETVIKGLGIFDLYTQNPGENVKRLIGNVAIESDFGTLIGFENHGGRTYLGKNINPLGKVLKGFGNNGKDKTEGAIYKNSFGSYFHGPILPKNPKLADYLIKLALEKKYDKKINLSPINNSIEQRAREVIAKRMGVAI